MRSNSTQFRPRHPASRRRRRDHEGHALPALHAGQRLHQPRVQRRSARTAARRPGPRVRAGPDARHRTPPAPAGHDGPASPAQMHAVQQDGRATAPRQPGQLDQRLDGRVVAGTDVFHASAPKALMARSCAGVRRRGHARAAAGAAPCRNPCADRRHIADIARAGAAGPRRGRSWPDGRGRDRRHQGVSLITVCTVQPSLAPVAVHQRQLRRDGQALHARCIANMVARRMFRLSISWTLALAMNQPARARGSPAPALRAAPA